MNIVRAFGPLCFGICWFLSATGCGRHEPVGYTLLYEVDPADAPNKNEIDMADFVKRIDRRVNPKPTGEVRLTSNGQFQIDLYGSNPQTIADIKCRLRQVGLLSFRIVATQHDNADLILRAVAMPLNKQKLYSDKEGIQGPLLAQWIPIVKSEVSNFEGSPNFGLRTSAQDELEILVVMDPYNVNGSHLQQATAEIDSRTKMPMVNFAFNELGANLFGGLTGSNLPGPDGHHRQLGIILDDHLQSAPRIVSIIRERGQINGNFTEQETRNLAALLKAGPFPARLRLVRESAVDPAAKDEK